MAEDDHVAVRGNTCTVTRWHIGEPLKKAEADRKAAFETAEAARLQADYRRRYASTREEREKSSAQWRKWLSLRFDRQGAPDFVSGWRDFVAVVEETEAVGEARFSNVVAAAHDKCVLCEEMEKVRADETLEREELRRGLQRWEHSVPRLVVSSPKGGSTAVQGHEEPIWDDIVGASAWGHQSTVPAESERASTHDEMLRDMSPKADAIDGSLNSKDYPLSRTITKLLAQSDDDTDLINNLLSNKAIMRYHDTVMQRVKVYRANRSAEEARLVAADCHKRLSTAEIRIASKASADALELQRDLRMLETTRTACNANIALVRACPGVLDTNKWICETRSWTTKSGFFHRQQGGRESYTRSGGRYTGDYEGNETKEVAEEQEAEPSCTGQHTREGNHGTRHADQKKFMPGTPPQAGQRTTVSNESPKGATILTVSPEAQTDGPGPFMKTMQEFNRHTRREEDSIPTSNDGDPSALIKAFDVVPETPETAGSSSEVATTPSSKGREKKDSKVEGLLEEDGVSLKDFAVKHEPRKSKQFRTISVKGGSSSRPAWR